MANKPTTMLTKKPKYPTRLEESMLRRKRGGYVCTCFDDDVENAHYARMHPELFNNAEDVRLAREAEVLRAAGKDEIKKDEKEKEKQRNKIGKTPDFNAIRKGGSGAPPKAASRDGKRGSSQRSGTPTSGRAELYHGHGPRAHAMYSKMRGSGGMRRGGGRGRSMKRSDRSRMPGPAFTGRPAAMMPGGRRADTPMRLGAVSPRLYAHDRPSCTIVTQTPGFTIPIQAVLSTQLGPDPFAIFSKSSGTMDSKRCPRTHVMYKTPEQVLRDMDEERDRMVLMAEITDLIERKKCNLKEQKKRKKIQKKPGEMPTPCWYQELTASQMRTVEMLGGALMSDMEEGIMDRTVILVNRLGLKPPPNAQIIWHVMVNCFTSPVLFLLYLAKCLEPKFRLKDKNGECMYAVRERILLSGFVHLMMPRTLFDLHFIMPQPKILNILQQKAPIKFKLNKRYYTSPYCEPQSIFIKERLDEIEKNKYKLVEELEMIKKAHVPTNEEFYEKCPIQTFDEQVDYNLTVEKHYEAVKRQHKVLAKSSRAFLERHYGQENDEENNFFRQISYLPTLDPQFPNQTYSFLRYATSTEPFDTSALPQIQENQDHEGFEPMMSFRECLYTWDDYPVSEICGSHIPPVTDIRVEKNSPMMQMLTLEGYWHAYPRYAYCKDLKHAPCTYEDPYESPIFVNFLKKSLQYLASKGNPLAALPDAYLLPHIQKWVLKRNRFSLTQSHKKKLIHLSDYAFEKGRYKLKLQRLPWIKLPIEKLHTLTWDSRCLLEKLVKKEKEKFYGRLQTWMVNDSRKFWDTMFMKYHDAPYFRDVFFTYCPSKQSDVKFPCRIVRK